MKERDALLCDLSGSVRCNILKRRTVILAPRHEIPAAKTADCTVCGQHTAIRFGASELTEEKIRRQTDFMGPWLRVSKEKYDYTHQDIFCCSVCGHIFIDPILDDETTLELIFASDDRSPPAVSSGWENVLFERESTIWSRAVRIPSLNRVLAPYLTVAGRVLDIGAHGGEISLGLRIPEGSFIDLLQVENSNSATKPPRPHVRQFQGLLKHFRSSDYLADILLALHVLEHSESPSEFLRQANSLMSPHSILVIEVPYELPLALQIASNEVFEIPHNSFFTPWSLRSLLDRSPLHTVEMELLDNFHSGNGEIAFPVIRAIARGAGEGATSHLEESPHNFARTIDKLCGNLSGSLAYIGHVRFLLFVYNPKLLGLIHLFSHAPGFAGAVTSNPAISLPNVFGSSLDGIEFLFTASNADRDALKTNLKTACIVH